VRLTQKIRVHGRVQGVFFRNWGVEQARDIGVDGWVRNRRDGTVELLVSGDAEVVDALRARVREGPPRAHVERTEIETVDEAVEPGFSRAPTV
jgi:acylphosphatase